VKSHCLPSKFFCLFRLLLTLTEEDFTKEPYSIENNNHKKAITTELECVKTLGVKPPQNLWEYKVNSFYSLLSILSDFKSCISKTILLKSKGLLRK